MQTLNPLGQRQAWNLKKATANMRKFQKRRYIHEKTI
nr:MAG TPA: hypothetical protein [Caudoviricetes sp.]